MKKLTVLVFTLVCVLGLFGCNKRTDTMYRLGIVADGVFYEKSYQPLPAEVDERAIIGYIASFSDTTPSKDGETNISKDLIGAPYAKVEGGIAILYKNEWYLCTSDEPVAPTGPPTEITADIAVSYANWVEPNALYFGALNNDKMAISSVQHLPIYRFDTLEQFEQFKSSYDPSDLEQGYDEVPSFSDTIAGFDKNFFDENTLMLVYVGASSGTYRFGVNSVFCDGTSFCIHVEQTNHPLEVTDDEAGWLIVVAVPDGMVENCTEFDADLNNFN